MTKMAKWISSFGGEGTKDGQFNLPHGLWIDDRRRERSQRLWWQIVPMVDCNGSRLEGKHQKTMNDFILPANVDSYKELLLVPDLASRVTLLDANNKVIAHLGADAKVDRSDESKKTTHARNTQPLAGRSLCSSA